VTGIFDLASEIRQMAQVKPIIAHANELALSGGYVLASAANEIYTPRTGKIGSIGVRMMHVDQSKYDAKRGFVYTDIFAGERKNDFSEHEPLSDVARAWAQSSVDYIYGIFVDHVAEMRGLDPQAVRDQEAAVYLAHEASDLGLIDGIATIGDTFETLRALIEAPRGEAMRMAARSADRESQLSADAEREEMDMATDTKPTLTADDLANAQKRGYEEGKAEAEKAAAAERANATTAAEKAAQERIAAILGHAEAQGRDALAKHFAFDTALAADVAIAALTKAPKEAPAVTAPKNPLAAAMTSAPNPNVGPDVAHGADEESVEALAASIINAGKRKKAA
jgi:ClpP class serine protease